MEPGSILKTATVLLALGALGGLLMAGMRFAGRPHPPAWLAMLHGVLAAAAITLLLYAAATSNSILKVEFGWLRSFRATPIRQIARELMDPGRFGRPARVN